MNNDLISRSALMCEIDWLNRSYPEDCGNEVAEKLVKLIEQAPAVDAEPVRHGRWIDRGDYVTTAYGSLDLKICSECNAEVTLDGYDYYCPHCGAKMDAEVSE